VPKFPPAAAKDKLLGMEFTVHIPDDIAERLGGSVNGDLSRRALEALLAEEYGWATSISQIFGACLALRLATKM
jgi:hypothetical protein